MKAKQYFEKILQSNDSIEFSTTNVIIDILREHSVIAKQRKITTILGSVSILKELEQKTRALLRLVNQDEKIVRDDAFRIVASDIIVKDVFELYFDRYIK